MQRFINCKGEVTETEPLQILKLPECYTGKIEKSFRIDVYAFDEKGNEKVVGSEYVGGNSPDDGKILWTILQYHGDFAQIVEMYRPEIDC